MSVILRNKQMPGDCLQCGAYYNNADMTLRCPYDRDLDVSGCVGRHKNCPLVNVSDTSNFVYSHGEDIYLRITTYGYIHGDIPISREKAKSLRKQLKMALKKTKKERDNGLS